MLYQKKTKNKPPTEQFDNFRFNYLDKNKLRGLDEEMTNLNRQILRYARDPKAANELMQYVQQNKTIRARLYNKDTSISGGWNNRWSMHEQSVLCVCMMFVSKYGGGVGWGYNFSPISAGNIRIIFNLYEAIIMKEKLDICYSDYFKERTNKAIRDRLCIIAGYNGNDPTLRTICKLLHKFGFKDKEVVKS